MRKVIFITTIIASLMVLFVFNNSLQAQMPHNRGGHGQMNPGDRGGFWSQLTDEQKVEVQAKIQQLREQGATRQEIHEAVKELMQSFGVEIPDNPPRAQRGRRGGNPVFSQLTDEQKAELRQTVQQLRQQGATREEIRESVNQLLQSWGVEIPDRPENGFHRGGRPGMRLLAELTSDQRKELRETIQNLRQQQASREEIVAAVKNLHTGWGVEIPENFEERFLAGPPERGHFWKELTDEQKQELRAKVRDLLANGADFEAVHDSVMQQIQQWGYDVPTPPEDRPARGQKIADQLTEEQKAELRAKIVELLDANAEPAEIFKAVGEMLNDWGIEPPHRGFRGRHPFPPEIMDQLTEEQRQAIHDKVEEMRQQGATRQEIREAVHQMLEEYGVKFPPKPGNRAPGKAGGKTGYRGNGDLKIMNYPNPFNPETQISYTLSDAKHITLKIYNMQGQLIRTLVDESQSAGTHSVKWDGTNDAGEKVVSGVYLYKLQAGNDSFSHKMMLMK